MDNVCITFHVIANSNVRKKKSDKHTNKNRTVPDDLLGTWTVSCEQLGSTAHAFLPPDSGHSVDISE